MIAARNLAARVAARLSVALATVAVTLGVHAQTLPPPPASPRPVADYLYDAQGNQTHVVAAPGSGLGTNGAGFATVVGYDSLHRRHSVLDARGKTTLLGHSPADHLSWVRDPRQLTTGYSPDAFGQSRQLASPDTGVSTQTYDAAGNLLTRLDSRGVLATHGYDGLNRLRSIAYTKAGQPSLLQAWGYDQQGPGFSHGVGRLTSTQFPGGSATYAYDAHGRLTSTTQTVSTAEAALAHTTGYSYDGAGRITRITYPSGRVLHITRNGGVPASLGIAPNASSAATPLVSSLQFEPLPGGTGPARTWLWHLDAGTLAHERVFDTWGRMVRHPLGGAVRDIHYDAADRISAFTHLDAATGAAVPALNQGFGYDELGRLTSVSTGVGSWTLAYDDNGNRTAVNHTPAGGSSVMRQYGIDAASNRLLTLSNPTRNFTHDAAGNTESDQVGFYGFTAQHDLAGRMVQLNAYQAGGYSFSTAYVHDNRGLRVLKQAVLAQRCNGSPGGPQACLPMVGISAVYVYDQAGQLLGEYDADNGAVLREYVWLEGMPLAVIDGTPASSAIHYIQADHLNTPRVVIDRAGRQRWSWVAEPFGNSAPVEDPIGVGAFQLNLRMPGQYWDRESGLAYNWHRSYDAGIGRYTQSDPIGLAGGINTYTYANGNPISYVDPEGLAPSPGDNSLHPPTHNCTCMTKCLAASHNEAYPACAFPAGVLGRMTRVPGAGIPVAYACQKIFVRRRCEMLCGDFCAGKAECPPAFRDP